MCGAAVSYNCGKLLHVANGGSSHAEYMELEKTMRSVIWLRELFLAAQIFRVRGIQSSGGFGKICRLHNGCPVYTNISTGYFIMWVLRRNGIDYGGRWAVISDLGTGDVIALADVATPQSQFGPSRDTIWTSKDSAGKWTQNLDIHISENIGVADVVSEPIIVIGDNINALKWASVDAVTPGNKHVRTAYHWIKEHVRDGHVCIRDCESAMNLADFLTKISAGPHARQLFDASSGYSGQPTIPDKLKVLT
eukprot:SAG31_NODE_316_length_17841_cov_33.716154_11_plen_250_part_00